MEEDDETKPKFQGAGQTLRGGTKRKGGEGDGEESKEKAKEGEKKDGSAGGGRTLRDAPK